MYIFHSVNGSLRILATGHLSLDDVYDNVPGATFSSYASVWNRHISSSKMWLLSKSLLCFEANLPSDTIHTWRTVCGKDYSKIHIYSGPVHDCRKQFEDDQRWSLSVKWPIPIWLFQQNHQQCSIYDRRSVTSASTLAPASESAHQMQRRKFEIRSNIVSWLTRPGSMRTMLNYHLFNFSLVSLSIYYVLIWNGNKDFGH